MNIANRELSVGLHEQMMGLGSAAREAAGVLARTPGETRNAVLRSAASEIRGSMAAILEANDVDCAGRQAAWAVGRDD